MKKLNFTYIFIFAFTLVSVGLYAGNKDRVGQAGATELLINPWARSSGMHSLNQASTRGLEAMRLNVGGLAFTNKTQVILASGRWLSGSDITLTTFGLAQAVGETGVLGVNVSSMSFGDIERTVTSNPSGTGGNFRPSYTNIGIAYSKSFSESIHGGVLLRIITHSISDGAATGVAFDTGIQYVTGENDHIKFGIALRNVGTPMKLRGDGLEKSAVNDVGEETTFSERTEAYELPSLLHIGGAYDLYFGDDTRLTLAANFTSNSFRNDFLGGGIEFAFREMFMLRAGYKYEDGALDDLQVANSALTGLAAGLTVELPLGKESESKIGFDYSYRTTHIYNGVHSLGIKIDL